MTKQQSVQQSEFSWYCSQRKKIFSVHTLAGGIHWSSFILHNWFLDALQIYYFLTLQIRFLSLVLSGKGERLQRIIGKGKEKLHGEEIK
jgi:hypothetical protein